MERNGVPVLDRTAPADEVAEAVPGAGCAIVERLAGDDLLRLMGDARGAYALGDFGDTQDPIEAVWGERADRRGFAATAVVGEE